MMPKSRSTNQLSFNLAAKITNITPATIPLGVATQVTLTVSPKVLPAQSPVLPAQPLALPAQTAMLLYESLQVPADTIAQETLTFTLKSDKKLDPTPVYLRIDGVDSLPITRLANPRRLAFDSKQTVTVP
jgi:hypothetical protein